MSNDILRELAACKASDPYRTKAWIPHMRGKWMTVNVPADLWERVQAAARPPECVGKDPRGCWNVRCQLGESCCRIAGVAVGIERNMDPSREPSPALVRQADSDLQEMRQHGDADDVLEAAAHLEKLRHDAGVDPVQAPSGLTDQLQRAAEASDAGHDPLCMAVLRGKACTCDVTGAPKPQEN